MNILVLAPQPFFQDRGTPIATRQLLATLAAHGHELDVLAYHEGSPVDIPHCTIHRIFALPGLGNIPPGPSWKKYVCDVLMLLACVALLLRRRWDVIHAVEEGVFIALVMRAVFGVPFVYDMDSSLWRQLADKYRLPRLLVAGLRRLERLAVRQSRGVVAVCKALEQEARAMAPGIPVVRIEDASLLANQDGVGEPLRESLGIAGHLIVYVGNLEAYQGIDLLLAAFARVAPRRPDVHLVVIGGAARDVERYRRRAESLGTGPQTFFVGPRPVDRLGGYLAQADVLVSPRIQGNNTPMKIYSYLDSGKPLLATRLPTHTQVLDDRIACLVDPEPESLALGMERLLDDSEFSCRLAQRAQLRVRAQFDPKLLARRLVAFYARLERDLCPQSEGAKIRIGD